MEDSKGSDSIDKVVDSGVLDFNLVCC